MSSIEKNIQPKSKRGGARPGAGRPLGSLNRATADLKVSLESLARLATPEALETLIEVALTSKSDSARVAAACALLDRGYGRPRQAVELKPGTDGRPLRVQVNVVHE